MVIKPCSRIASSMPWVALGIESSNKQKWVFRTMA
jgi:hypothetical protein